MSGGTLSPNLYEADKLIVVGRLLCLADLPFNECIDIIIITTAILVPPPCYM